MTTHTVTSQHVPERHPVESTTPRLETLRFLAPLGRTLFVAIFLISSFHHFSSQGVAYAASHGVPIPGLLVPLSGVMAVVGGLSVLLGYKTRIGALLLVAFLIPVTLFMHQFWSVTDPMMAQIQVAAFLKNVSMIGGALLLVFFGGGPYSLDVLGEHDRP